VGHSLLHPPQWSASVSVSTQSPPQSMVPSGHRHVPDEHTWPAGQALSQLPQWLALVMVSTQVVPQSVGVPAGHLSLVPPSDPHPAATRAAAVRARKTLFSNILAAFMVRSFPLSRPQSLENQLVHTPIPIFFKGKWTLV
jgi:hypothetical protein